MARYLSAETKLVRSLFGMSEVDKSFEKLRDRKVRYPLYDLIQGPITSLISFLKPEDSSIVGDPQQFKRLQNERGRRDHDVWMTIPDQTLIEPLDDAEITRRGLEILSEEGSDSKLKSRVIELKDELRRLYGAYGDLKELHEKLWKKYVEEKMEEQP